MELHSSTEPDMFVVVEEAEHATRARLNAKPCYFGLSTSSSTAPLTISIVRLLKPNPFISSAP